MKNINNTVLHNSTNMKKRINFTALRSKREQLEKQQLYNWSIECYFKHPETGEIGWSIEIINVSAHNKDEAAAIAKALPNFDCFIDLRFDKYNEENSNPLKTEQS